MKKKASGLHHARIIGKGFPQKKEVDCESDDISSPVVQETVIMSVFGIALMK